MGADDQGRESKIATGRYKEKEWKDMYNAIYSLWVHGMMYIM